ncbi:MAG: nitroreductase family protein [Clostridia bacterium]|nr:nitroreductase family protein [Clostridia bacterium]
MNFMEIAKTRQSCRSFDPDRPVETEKLMQILESARLAPSACNAQPYHITLCTGDMAKKVEKETQGMGMNRFATDAPAVFVLSEMPYNKTAAIGAKAKRNDYRSIDIGTLSAYITLEATAQGLSTCILGWFDDEKIRSLCGLSSAVRLVIPVGYAAEGDPLREKKRKPMEELVSFME